MAAIWSAYPYRINARSSSEILFFVSLGSARDDTIKQVNLNGTLVWKKPIPVDINSIGIGWVPSKVTLKRQASTKFNGTTIENWTTDTCYVPYNTYWSDFRTYLSYTAPAYNINLYAYKNTNYVAPFHHWGVAYDDGTAMPSSGRITAYTQKEYVAVYSHTFIFCYGNVGGSDTKPTQYSVVTANNFGSPPSRSLVPSWYGWDKVYDWPDEVSNCGLTINETGRTG